jgi:hypothetical protein
MNNERDPYSNPVLQELADKQPATVVGMQLSEPSPELTAKMEAERIPEEEVAVNLDQREVRSHRRRVSLGQTAMEALRRTGEKVERTLGKNALGRAALWLYHGAGHVAGSAAEEIAVDRTYFGNHRDGNAAYPGAGVIEDTLAAA